jgi:hypothetical protein
LSIVPMGAPSYSAPGAGAVPTATSGVPLPAGTLNNFRVRTSTQMMIGTTLTVTVLVDGVSTGISCIVDGSSASDRCSSANTFSMAAGQAVAVQFDMTGPLKIFSVAYSMDLAP